MTQNNPHQTGLVFWLDASQATSLSNLARVGSVTTTNTPTLITERGNQYLHCTTDQTWQSNALNLSSAAYTVIYVGRITTTQPDVRRTLTSPANIGNNWLLGTWAGFQNAAYVGNFVGGTPTTPATTDLHLYSLYFDGNTPVLRNESGEVARNGGGDEPQYVGVNIFGNEDNDCNIAEVLVYDQRLNLNHVTQIENYLKSKWFANVSAAYDGEPFNRRMNDLAGLDGSYSAQYAANVYAGTTGLSLVGALNAKAGTSGVPLQGVLNILAGTSGLGIDEAARRIGA